MEKSEFTTKEQLAEAIKNQEQELETAEQEALITLDYSSVEDVKSRLDNLHAELAIMEQQATSGSMAVENMGGSSEVLEERLGEIKQEAEKTMDDAGAKMEEVENQEGVEEVADQLKTKANIISESGLEDNEITTRVEELSQQKVTPDTILGFIGKLLKYELGYGKSVSWKEGGEDHLKKILQGVNGAEFAYTWSHNILLPNWDVNSYAQQGLLSPQTISIINQKVEEFIETNNHPATDQFKGQMHVRI